MHYIRFLKSPKVIRGKNGNGLDVLSAKITVTTDLGEAFLLEDVGLVVELLDKDDNLVGKAGGKLSWKGKYGMRALEVNISIPKTKTLEGVRMAIRPSDQVYSTKAFIDILGLRSKRRTPFEGGVVAVRSPLIDLKTGQSTHYGLAERNFVAQDGTEISIWEETGESIARHIWDAGLVLSAYISVALPLHPSPMDTPLLPNLQKTLVKKDLNVLELGAGCGIVGITLATLSEKHNQQYLLTDLPEASEILQHNISTSSLPMDTFHHQTLDWSQPLPSSLSTTKWDLILIADCTYNPDVVPSLVATLSQLRDLNPDLQIVVAMKIRHESESVFFDLMKEAGFVIREQAKWELPVLAGEAEEIEGFVFEDDG